MKLRPYFVLSCLLALASGGVIQAAPKSTPHASKTAATNSEGPKVRVLLEKDASYALLEAKGEYCVVNKSNGELLSSGSSGKRFVIHALQEGLRWGEEYPDVYQLTIIPKSDETTLFVNGMQYKGTLSVYHCKDNHITIVNDIAIEEFLKSTLTLEMEEPLSKEAMAAFTIAARTDVFSKVVANRGSRRPWDLTANEVNYFGYSVTEPQNFIEEAIEWTRFMVLESKNGEGPLQNVKLNMQNAKELADKGYDAKKILQSTCPQAKLGVTMTPKATAMR